MVGVGAGEESVSRVVAELGRRRRRVQRRRFASPGERVVDIYAVVVAVAVFGLGLLPSLFGSPDASRVMFSRSHGAAITGVVVSVLVGIGLRSGAYGGPLLLSAADVQHVLLAPVEHSAAVSARVRRGALRCVVAASVLGAVAIGTAATMLTARPFSYVASGAATGAAVGAASFGAALLARHRRISPASALVFGAVLVAWTAFDLGAGLMTSPATWLGAVSFPPSGAPYLGAVGTTVAAALLAAGLRSRGDIDLERALQRSAAGSAIVAGVALQDLRALFLATHARPDEMPRARPWAAPPPPTQWPRWRRAWQGLLRFPPTRLARLGLLGVAVGVIAAASVAVPFLAVFAIAAGYVAVLEAVEPIAQEIDRPTLRALRPMHTGRIYLGMVGGPVAVMTVLFVLAAAAAAAVGQAGVGTTLLAAAVPGSLAGVLWAIYALARGRPGPETNLRFVMDPTGVAIYTYHLGPAVGAGVTVIAALIADRTQAPVGASAAIASVAAAFAFAALAWVSRTPR